MTEKCAHQHVQICRDDMYYTELVDEWGAGDFFDHSVDYHFPSIIYDEVCNGEIEQCCFGGKHSVVNVRRDVFLEKCGDEFSEKRFVMAKVIAIWGRRS